MMLKIETARLELRQFTIDDLEDLSKASLNYGFELLKLERIVAIAQPENVASQRVMQKVTLSDFRFSDLRIVSK